MIIETEYSDHLKNFALFFDLNYEVEVIIMADYPVNVKTIKIRTELSVN